jgi:hypothetical protein
VLGVSDLGVTDRPEQCACLDRVDDRTSVHRDRHPWRLPLEAGQRIGPERTQLDGELRDVEQHPKPLAQDAPGGWPAVEATRDHIEHAP